MNPSCPRCRKRMRYKEHPTEAVSGLDVQGAALVGLHKGPR